MRVAVRSKAAERAWRYRERKKARKAASILGRDEASSPMQLELEQAKRQNARLEKQVDDLTHQMQQINQAMLANAGMGVPMPGIPRQQAPMMPAPPVAQPVPVAMPRAPSFGSFLDAQILMINAHHDSARKPGR